MRRSALVTSVLLFVSVFAVYCAYVKNLLDNEPIVSLPKISLLDEVTLPADKDDDVRVIFVGDVHGQYHEMVQLFEKTGLDNTTVVLLGDFLAKGPDSVQVANFILNNKDKVKCVLGNHDLAVMFAFLNPRVAKFPWYKNRRNLKPLQFTLTEETFIPGDYTKIKPMHLDISRQLGPEKMISLAQHCSAALHLDLGEEKVYAVHAGMLPGDFNNRIPSIESLTEMKFVDRTNWSKFSKEKESKQFLRWFKLWKGSKLPDELMTTYVLYGHDANKGLNIRGHTMGLDTGCVKGGELTGMEFTRVAGKVTTKLHQIRCSGSRRAALLSLEQKARNEGKDIEDLDEWKNLVNGGKPVPHNEYTESPPGPDDSEEAPKRVGNSEESNESKSEKLPERPEGDSEETKGLQHAGRPNEQRSGSSDENRQEDQEQLHESPEEVYGPEAWTSQIESTRRGPS
ncbi:hypothetical protein ZYGR_0AS06570 [Zygosaccharomyces rouxii]|uniref:Calcineurin-like phosphoesterase domain-containing protein n=1 Tax=Zygosaccharomyces rouxii TaxID=4956 RepID=A0A1Q3AIK4_ZYGRO|nr:hypothetical protein ZYGR_0AS06570 [Zygosaccharomyces rouxii]